MHGLKRFTSVICVFFVACAPAKVAKQPAVAAGPGLKTYGSLREIFHQNKTDAVVALDTLLPNKHLYGVGALSGLRGEITIIDGQVTISVPQDSSLVRTEFLTQSDERATLLVTDEVFEWKAVVTESDVVWEDLEEKIAELALVAGVDIGAPFPFLVEGILEDLEWHVIDGRRLQGGAGDHESHRRAAIGGAAESVNASLIGFYSTAHEGVFTHMGSATHIHCVVKVPAASGHLERVRLPAGTRIFFPDR